MELMCGLEAIVVTLVGGVLFALIMTGYENYRGYMFWKGNDLYESARLKNMTLARERHEILKVCVGNTSYMWAAKIVSIILECDFRDSEQELKKYFGEQYEELLRKNYGK